jgi:hypothetical protein
MIYAFWGWLGVAFMLSKAVAMTAAGSDIGTLFIYENYQSQTIRSLVHHRQSTSLRP